MFSLSPPALPARPWLRPVWRWAIACLAGAALAGCVQTRVIEPAWDNLPADSGSRNSQQANSDQPGQWAVQVKTFSGPDRQEQAHQLLRQLNEAGLEEVWMSDIAGTAMIYCGRFQRQNSAEAQQTLQQVRQVELDGSQPFRDAQIAPLTRDSEQITDPYNLKAYSGHYSLQVGFYDDQWDGDRRQAAEEAAAAIREGRDVKAYFYHGPHRSMVTVGLFTESEAFEMRPDPLSPGRSRVRAWSQAVRQLQEAFPYNLANGRKLLERFEEDQEATAQPSTLIRIP